MKPIRNSIKALIIEGGKVLAVKLQDGEGFWWTLPGGGQEPGETMHETLRRECLEEIGVEVEAGDLVLVREYIGKNHEFAAKDSEAHQIEFMFLCRLPHGAQPRNGSLPDTGQLAVEWLDISRLDNYRLYPLALRPVIMNYADGGPPVYLGDMN